MRRIVSIFLEGDFDGIMFKNNIIPLFEKNGFDVELIRYRQEMKKFITEYLTLVQKLPIPHRCIFVGDLDRLNTADQKKKEIIRIYNDNLTPSKIFIIIKMIEGWYLGGLPRESAKSLGVDVTEFDKLNPNTIKKDQFKRLKPPHFVNKRAFYIAIAKRFDLELAKSRNKSFKQFLTEYKLQ
jgi:hypothetical protein